MVGRADGSIDGRNEVGSARITLEGAADGSIDGRSDESPERVMRGIVGLDRRYD